MATTYSFMDVSATLTDINGDVVSLGYGAGTAKEGITVEMSDDKTKLDIGADGTPMHSLRASNAGRLLVRLLKTSPTNNQLSLIYNVQRYTPFLWGQNVISVRDVLQGDVISASAVAFARQPVVTYAEDANMNEWQFLCGVIDELLGLGIPDLAAVI
jgi:predicted SPOUT superfamily RNA methylase MTH1